jgi:WD40 repeat protein
MESHKKSQFQSNNLHSENVNELKVNNSIIYYRLKENAHSRSLVTIPDENQNSFLVGVTAKTQCSELIKVVYDELNKKLSTQTVLDFNKEKEGQEKQLINEITNIYPRSSTDFLINVFNSTTNKYELKLFDESKIDEYTNISCLCSDDIFDLSNYGNKKESINAIDKYGLKFIDLNKDAIASTINFADEKEIIDTPMKISSDISLLDENVLGCALGKNVYTCDLRENKISHQINDVHDGSVLSFQFDPVSPFIFCTSGTDFALKFWDIRKPNTEFGGIYNNSHWIWSLKYNKSYSNVMVTASSSSLVRGIIFDKYDIGDEKNKSLSSFEKYSSDKNIKKYSFIDYVEFEDSVYSLDWLKNDSWTFVAISFNAYFHVNSIPEEVKYKIML